MNKQFTVITGPIYAPVTSTVELPGVPPDERLTPKLARQAARAAGADGTATVWSDEDYGYRLYERSARKIKKQ
jgi:hypothetical protein